MFSLLSVLLLACEPQTPSPSGSPNGAVVLCKDGARPSGDDQDLVLTGTITDVGSDTDCGATFTIDDGAGTVATFGVNATDADGEAVALALGVSQGDTVDLTWRYRLVWGDVMGLVLRDGDGLLFAAEEGQWGGALAAEDTPELEVGLGAVYQTVATACMPREDHTVQFATGDDEVEVAPVAADHVAVGTTDLTVWAMAAYTWAEGDGCSVEDGTDALAWWALRGEAS